MDTVPVANPRKTEGVRRLGSVDVAALRDAVLAMSEAEWDRENGEKPNRFEALDSTRHVVFRFVANLRDWRSDYDRPIWTQWRDLIQPVLDQAVAPYGYTRGTFPRIMLARMPGGGIIKPHRDANLAAKWPHKIHIPLQTNGSVTFFIAGNEYYLPEGEAAELDNMAIHSVENRGSTDRIHLVFEYYDADQPNPEWLLPATEAASPTCRSA